MSSTRKPSFKETAKLAVFVRIDNGDESMKERHQQQQVVDNDGKCCCGRCKDSRDEEEKEQQGSNSNATTLVGDIDAEDAFEFYKESKLLLGIALPTILIQISTFLIFPLTASAVGRNLGTSELAGYSLGSLTGNLLCLSFIQGILSAADTLMPRAFGLNQYNEIGLLAIRGFISAAAVLVVPIVILGFGYTNKIFLLLHQDPVVSTLATEWLRIYIFGIPFILLLRIIQKFLASQHIVMPMLYATSIGCFIIHPIILKLLVTSDISQDEDDGSDNSSNRYNNNHNNDDVHNSFGFMGSSLSLVLTQFFQVILILQIMYWVKPHRPETWPSSCLSTDVVLNAIKVQPMVNFFILSLGGLLSFSEWWFWETMCFIAGSFGVIPLCIHTIAYNLIPILFMIPLGLSIGLSVRMGNVLAFSVKRAKLIAFSVMVLTIVLACALSFIIYNLRDVIIQLFTSDDEVINGCRLIWNHLCVYIILLYIYAINAGIMRALGLQWPMATIIIVVLWIGCLPMVIRTSIYEGHGVIGIWKTTPYFYCLMNIILILKFTFFVDWDQISHDIRQRFCTEEKTSNIKCDEHYCDENSMQLIVNNDDGYSSLIGAGTICSTTFTNNSISSSKRNTERQPLIYEEEKVYS